MSNLLPKQKVTFYGNNFCLTKHFYFFHCEQRRTHGVPGWEIRYLVLKTVFEDNVRNVNENGNLSDNLLATKRVKTILHSEWHRVSSSISSGC